MTEITVLGRGGQGTVIASEILASALFKEKKYVQAFPFFGAERRGAPVAAYLRFDDKPILIRSQIYTPDHLIILEPSFINVPDFIAGLKKGGWIVLNSALEPKNSELLDKYRLAYLDAARIAAEYQLTSHTAVVVNTIILGAFAKATELVKLQSILDSIDEFVPVKTLENQKAAQKAFEEVKILQKILV